MSNTDLRDMLIIALDYPKGEEALKLVDELGDQVQWYKVGLELFCAEGRGIVTELTRRGKRVFLDLKLHDIPNTVSGASRVLANLEVGMFTVHISGGTEMLSRTVASVREQATIAGGTPPQILGITMLTSVSQKEFQEKWSCHRSLDETVVDMAHSAKQVGLDGVVSSPKELQLLSELKSEHFSIVTPGIRFSDDVKEDQQRIATPRSAIANGAKKIVVGRPVTARATEKERQKALTNIYREMDRGKGDLNE